METEREILTGTGKRRTYNPAAGREYIEAQAAKEWETLDFSVAKAMLLSVAEAVVEAEPMLTKVDSAIGDGDHGIGMKTGLKTAHAELMRLPEGNNVYEPFFVVGNAMLMSMGGASGAIFGSMFMGGAEGKAPRERLRSEELAALMEDALRAVRKRGHAQVGDKTMVDALSPAVDAMKANAEKGLAVMLRAAEAAARAGMESTKRFEAKFGRAKTQGTTIGFQDAGATSVWVMLKAMADFAERYRK